MAEEKLSEEIKMCTVLQQHLNRQNGINPDENGATNGGFATVSVSPTPAGGRAESVALTPAPTTVGVSSYWVRNKISQWFYFVAL